MTQKQNICYGRHTVKHKASKSIKHKDETNLRKINFITRSQLFSIIKCLLYQPRGNINEES